MTFKAGFQENFVSGGSFTEAEILNNVQGKKDNYKIKEIKTLNPTGIVNLAANKKSLSFVKIGSFTATIVLEHDTKADVTLTKAPFTIAKDTATLTFKAGFQETFVSGGTFTETEILNNVQGSKTGYTIKEIKNINPTGIVNLAADKKSLSFVKAGSFTATIVLEHNTKPDVTLPNAPFTITNKTAAENLTFKAGFQESFVSGGSFTEAEILNNVQGKKDNYTIKEIKTLNPTGIVNLAANKKSLSFVKIGSFTATLVLEHNTKADATITNASFTIAKAAAENLNFKANFQETFVSGGSFTETEIFNNVQGSKTNYKIKEIKTLNPTGIVNLSSDKKSLSFVKVGNFTATIVLEHNTKADATITKAPFTITKQAAEKLTFKAGFENVFASGGSFTETEIFNNIQGNKTDYTIKEIKNISPTGIVNLSSDKKSLSFIKAGRFTATIVLKHNTKADVTLNNASFQIIDFNNKIDTTIQLEWSSSKILVTQQEYQNASTFHISGAFLKDLTQYQQDGKNIQVGYKVSVGTKQNTETKVNFQLNQDKLNFSITNFYSLKPDVALARPKVTFNLYIDTKKIYTKELKSTIIVKGKKEPQIIFKDGNDKTAANGAVFKTTQNVQLAASTDDFSAVGIETRIELSKDKIVHNVSKSYTFPTINTPAASEPALTKTAAEVLQYSSGKFEQYILHGKLFARGQGTKSAWLPVSSFSYGYSVHNNNNNQFSSFPFIIDKNKNASLVAQIPDGFAIEDIQGSSVRYAIIGYIHEFSDINVGNMISGIYKNGSIARLSSNSQNRLSTYLTSIEINGKGQDENIFALAKNTDYIYVFKGFKTKLLIFRLVFRHKTSSLLDVKTDLLYFVEIE